MSDREIKEQIRRKELQIERLEAEIREAKGYIASLKRRLTKRWPEMRVPTTWTRRERNAH